MPNVHPDASAKLSNLKILEDKSLYHIPKPLDNPFSLFSEIMKNHSNTPENTPTDKPKQENHCNVNYLDIPLPDRYPSNSDSSKNIRKRHMKIEKEDSNKRRRSHIKSESKTNTNCKKLPLPNLPNNQPQIKTERRDKEVIFSYPKVCMKRTKNRFGSTWGERSVKSFKIIAEVGEGTYGHVFKAVDRKNGAIKALKKIRLENEREGFPITTVREIKILQQLNHANIVQLNEVVTDFDLKSGTTDDKGFYLVFEYMDHDLFGIIDSGITLTDLQVASIMKQIIEGICYCHKRMFLHRDIKCSNILVNKKGEVKIADFGLARRFYADNIKRPYTNKVITLWYRAPELLLGEEIYGVAIDIWSIGCIMGELFTRRTMFTASNEFDQFEVISKVCGTPNTGVWPDIVKLPLYQTFRTKTTYKRRLREYYHTLPSSALEVLDWMLQLDPKRRCTSEQALNSYWLRKVDPKRVPPPQLPTDKDYHEMACKRRYKQNQSDTGYKSSKSSIKPLLSSSSSNDEILSNVVQNNSDNLKIPDEIMEELKMKISQFFPNSENILDSASLSQNVLEGKLEKLLEPYIKEIMSNNF